MEAFLDLLNAPDSLDALTEAMSAIRALVASFQSDLAALIEGDVVI